MAQQILQDLSYFTPELALTGTFLAAIVLDLIIRRTVWPVAALVLLGLGLTLALLLTHAGAEVSIFSNMIAVDPFAFYFKLVIVVSAIFVTVFSLQSAELNTPGRRPGRILRPPAGGDTRDCADGGGEQSLDDVPRR